MIDKLNMCQCCRFESNEPMNEVDVSRFNDGDTKIDKLCNLCYSSSAGSTYRYANNDNRVLQHINYVGNVLLAAIKTRRT